MNYMKRTTPGIPVGHPELVWTTGADVQRLWRKYGWTPPSEKRTPFVELVVEELALVQPMRRVK